MAVARKTDAKDCNEHTPKSAREIGAILIATSLLASCGDTDTASSNNNFDRSRFNIAQILTQLCESRTDRVLEDELITSSQRMHACECYRDSFLELEETELQNVIEYELAAQSGEASEISPNNRPSLKAMAAMHDANACLTPSAINALD